MQVRMVRAAVKRIADVGAVAFEERRHRLIGRAVGTRFERAGRMR